MHSDRSACLEPFVFKTLEAIENWQARLTLETEEMETRGIDRDKSESQHGAFGASTALLLLATAEM